MSSHAHVPDYGRAKREESHGHHVAPLRMYFTIFSILMVLLFVTVWIAEMELGASALAVAYAVAITKAVLIIMYFMHVKDQSRLVWIFAAASFLWVAIMLALTMADFTTRDAIPRADPSTVSDRLGAPLPAQPAHGERGGAHE